MTSCRRPLHADEEPYVTALGDALRTRRITRGLTQRQLAAEAQLSVKQIKRLENGTRRTRRSTLQRIAEALSTDVQPLVQAAGPTLAPESPYADRIARRRARRHGIQSTAPTPTAT